MSNNPTTRNQLDDDVLDEDWISYRMVRSAFCCQSMSVSVLVAISLLFLFSHLCLRQRLVEF
jgi:hypothetical protein